MMAKKNGLSPLKVGVARHYGINVLLGDFKNRLLKFLYEKKYGRNLVFQIKPFVERDLIVSRPSCVEFPAELADFFSKAFFYGHVYVFHVRSKNKLAGE